MQAAVVHNFGQPLVIETLPIPEIMPHQILVKLHACGVCHTDLHAACGDWPVPPTLPFIPGHEGVGEVVAIGAQTTLFHPGDRVGVPWLYSACGQCEFCFSGWETLCHSQKNTGYSVNGCFAQYVAVDPNYIIALPPELDYFTAASLLCAGLTAYKGIKEAAVKAGDWLVVSGVGGLGHMAIQYAKAMGLNVIAIDLHPAQLALAASLHADKIINAALEDPVTRVQQEIHGAHGVLVTAVSPAACAQAVAMLRRGGTASLVGLPPGNFSLSIFDMVINRKTVRGSIVGTRLDLLECMALAAAKKVHVNYTVESLENINTVFEKMRRAEIVGRIVLKLL